MNTNVFSTFILLLQRDNIKEMCQALFRTRIHYTYLGLCVGCSDFQSPIFARIFKPYCQLKAKDRQGICVVYT
jgi:hypothetical protein